MPQNNVRVEFLRLGSTTISVTIPQNGTLEEAANAAGIDTESEFRINGAVVTLETRIVEDTLVTVATEGRVKNGR